MSVRSFIDTNVLVYADSSDTPEKQHRAVDLIQAHHIAGSGVLSTQVLQEFTATALRKLLMPPAVIHERLDFFAGFEIVNSSPLMISQALQVKVRWNLSFYDALIVQAAIQSGCAELLTEDLQHGATMAGVKIVNPFKSN